MSAILFFFELASPYSYIASHQIERVASAAGRSVDWCPIDIEAVWSAQGVLEAYAAIRRLKRSYIARDSARCAAALGISLVRPPTPSRDTSLAKLAYWGLTESDPEMAKRFLRAVWHRHFGEGNPIGSAQDLAAAAPGLQLEPEVILSAAQSERARRAQVASNADAVRHGCFGVPWFVADGEAFFGQDRLLHLSERLRNCQPPRALG